MTVFVQSGHLEDVEDIVYVRLTQAKRKDRSGQIRMAVEIEGFPTEHLVYLGLLSRVPMDEMGDLHMGHIWCLEAVGRRKVYSPAKAGSKLTS